MLVIELSRHVFLKQKRSRDDSLAIKNQNVSPGNDPTCFMVLVSLEH